MRGRGRRHVKRVALACAITTLLAACGHGQTRPSIRLPNPGACTAIDIVVAPEMMPALHTIGDRFNRSPASKLGPLGCAFVRFVQMDSATVVQKLLDGWPKPETDGPPPTAWVPAAGVWGNVLDAREKAAGHAQIAPPGIALARTPTVIAMPEPMARVLGWPRTRIGWHDLGRLASDPRGWAALGHPEWGAFRFGKANPNFSTTALLATIAEYRTGAPVRALEQSVVYYGPSSSVYFDTWARLDANNDPTTPTASPFAYLSAAVTDERSVAAYDDSVNRDNEHVANDARPRVRMVAIRPSEGTFESDNPLIVLDAGWSSPDTRAGAIAFASFARNAESQTVIADAGFRPVRSGVTPTSSLLVADNGVETADARPLAAPSTAEVARVLGSWTADRKRARVLILFDESDSMRDPAGPQARRQPKIAIAIDALQRALAQLAPDDEIGLRVFTTGLPPPTTYWSDPVAVGLYARNKTALTRAISKLTAQRGSPLYRAVRGAYDDMRAHADPSRINAVIVVTDGYNEDDSYNDRTALLTHLQLNTIALTTPIRLVTIGYTPLADFGTMLALAEATDAPMFNAGEAVTVSTALQDAFSAL